MFKKQMTQPELYKSSITQNLGLNFMKMETFANETVFEETERSDDSLETDRVTNLPTEQPQKAKKPLAESNPARKTTLQHEFHPDQKESGTSS